MAIETGALVVGWNRAIVGRESAAAEAFATAVSYYEKQVKAGKLTSFEPYFLTAHGGDLNGFWILKGSHQNLEWIRSDEEFTDNLLRATHCLEGVGVIPAYTGAVIGDMMQRWMKTLPR